MIVTVPVARPISHPVVYSDPSAPSAPELPMVLGAGVAMEHAECIFCFEALHTTELACLFKSHHRSCEHVFHHKCIREWSASSATKRCPVCRQVK